MSSVCKSTVNENKKILISKKSPTAQKGNFGFNEYSLKQNFFDPTKNSPPNEFMLKLELRMAIYNSVIKEDNFINE